MTEFEGKMNTETMSVKLNGDLSDLEDILMKSDEMVSSIFERSAVEIVMAIYNDLKPELVYCNKVWYHCNKGIWERITIPTSIIIRRVYLLVNTTIEYISNTIEIVEKQKQLQEPKRHKEYDNIIEKLNKQSKAIEKSFKKIDTTGFTSQMINHLIKYLNDNFFLNKLDSTKNQLVFKNGILNLTNGQFKDSIEYNDYVSKTIPFDYSKSSKEELDIIRNIFFKICNANDEQTDYYSSILGYSLTGNASLEKSFWCLLGQSGNNGKTTILDALTSIMPEYCSKVSNKAFYESTSSNRHKHLSKMRGARIYYVEENIDDKNLDSSFLKEVADGRRISFEVLYGTTETMELVGKLFIITNNTPIFKTDDGIKNRYRQCQFNSKFESKNTSDDYETKQFIQDKNLLQKLENELAMPLINYLVGFSIDYNNNKSLKPLPEEWQELTNETLEDNDKISIFIEKHFELGTSKDHRIHKDELTGILADNGITQSQFKDAMKRLGINYEKSKRKGEKRGVWEGIKAKDELL